MASSVAFWRKWHRWIGFPASLFLLWAAGTGTVVAGTEFFGADEAVRERTRDLVSPVTVASPAADWADPVSRAVAAVERLGSQPAQRFGPAGQVCPDAPKPDVVWNNGGLGHEVTFSHARTSGVIPLRPPPCRYSSSALRIASNVAYTR